MFWYYTLVLLLNVQCVIKCKYLCLSSILYHISSFSHTFSYWHVRWRFFRRCSQHVVSALCLVNPIWPGCWISSEAAFCLSVTDKSILNFISLCLSIYSIRKRGSHLCYSKSKSWGLRACLSGGGHECVCMSVCVHAAILPLWCFKGLMLPKHW